MSTDKGRTDFINIFLMKFSFRKLNCKLASFHLEKKNNKKNHLKEKEFFFLVFLYKPFTLPNNQKEKIYVVEIFSSLSNTLQADLNQVFC